VNYLPKFPKNSRVTNPELLETVRTLPCLGCGHTPCDAHHVTSRGSGGDDIATNVMPLCREHHNEWHRRGLGYMVRSYPAIQFWLEGANRTDILERVEELEKPYLKGIV
jgi:hypothetical protein